MESDPSFVKELDAKAAAGDEACKTASVCLQAMRSVIVTNRVQPSPTAYFAAAVAALQRQGEQAAGPSGTTGALLLILRKAIPAAPPSAVVARFNDVVGAVSAILRKQEEDGLVRQGLGCLMAASDAAFSSGSRPNRKVLKPVFACLGHARAPVQHQAELTAAFIVKRAAAVGDQQTVDFASQHLVQMLGAARHDKKSGNEAPAQRALTLIRAVAPSLPADSIGVVCEALLRLPGQLGQHPCCIEAFEFLAEHLTREEEVAPAPPALPPPPSAALAARLLPDLLTVPVTMLNVMYVAAYSKVLASAVAALVGRGSDGSSAPEAGQKLAAMKTLLGLFSERDPTVLRGAREACVLALTAAGKSGDLAMLEEVPDLCLPLLGYEAKGSWRQVLPVIAAVFDALGTVRAARVSPSDVPAWAAARFVKAKGLLAQLVLARDKARAGELNVFGDELAACLGSAVAALGPERVLDVAELRILETPLGDLAYEQHSRSWLLLVLRDSCRRASLAFFAAKFLPLASALKARVAEAEQAQQLVMAKRYSTLLEQVWALLPAFCDEPLDLSAALLADGGRLAKQLVSVLQNEPQLRDYIWAAFTRACACTCEPPSPFSQALQESNRTCLQTLAARVLPEMFNTYLKVHVECEGQDPSRVAHSRQLALGAMQGYVRASDPAFVSGLFKKLVARLLKATAGQGTEADSQMGGAAADVGQAVPLADLASSLVPYLAEESLELTLKVFLPMLSGGSCAEDDKMLVNSLQRAAYRAVRSVVQHPAAAASDMPQGGTSRVLGLWNALRDARQTCSPAALKARLATLEAMLKLTERILAPRFQESAVRQEYLQCLTTVMPEVLFHLRDQSSAVRDSARECLHVAATTAIHQDLQAEIVALISAGLAGLTRYSKASALDALSRLMYEHHSRMTQELQERLISVVLLLLGDSDAQVWRAALKFAKVVVYVVPKARLEKWLPQLFQLFSSRHVANAKMVIRHIIERLVKVLPSESLTEAFPSEHLPLLHYVQRQLARQQRPKATRAVKTEEADDKGGAAAEDAEMGDDDEPRQSWEKFRAGEDAEAPSGRRRGRGGAQAQAHGPEPPTSAVAAHEAVQALLDAWEAESESDDEGAGRSRPSKGKRKRDAGETTTWIHEDKDVPLDFMSADAAHSVLTERAAPQKRRRAVEVGPAGAQSRADALRRSGLRFAADGRLVIDETVDLDKGKEGEEKAGFTLGAEPAKKVKPLSRLAAQRRARAEAKAKSKAQRRGGHLIKGLDIFKPGKSRAQGDARRNGTTLEPYAYVKLNPKVGKEKYKDKATKSFARVVKGAKKGVLRGKKAKARDEKLQKSKDVRKKRRKGSGKVRKQGSR